MTLETLRFLPASLPGKRSFLELSHELPSVRFVPVEKFIKPDGANRWSGFYDSKNKVVYFNPSDRIEEAAYGVFALHETLGALGIEDLHYQVSIPAYLLAKRRLKGHRDIGLDSILRNQIFMTKRPFANDKSQLEGPDSRLMIGGVDVVGGGGDSVVIAFKIKFMDYLENRTPWKLPADLRRLYSWYFVSGAPLEASRTLSSGIRYQLNEQTAAVEQILIPRAQAEWFLEHGDRADTQMVMELANFFRTYIDLRLSERSECQADGDNWLKPSRRSRRWPQLPDWRTIRCSEGE
ncbi:MAG: hypothetical protein KF789_14405 [Bdellovibrionaceae bacterium]|nr:hypothetical protein [Pseudobdellovibrionaceae bacterium]